VLKRERTKVLSVKNAGQTDYSFFINS